VTGALDPVTPSSSSYHPPLLLVSTAYAFSPFFLHL
jgi:hypothetical protein